MARRAWLLPVLLELARAESLPPACPASAAGGPSTRLSSGFEMPLVGLGTWKSTPGEVGHAVGAALRVGYRHIDCAAIYGNEKEIGLVLKEMVGDGEGQIRRSELFITSKLWNSEHEPRHVRPALEQTLADLQLDYLDLYLVHWPQAFAHVDGSTTGRPTHPNGSMIYNFETAPEATWQAMEALVTAGLVRSIGLSNYNEEQIRALLPKASVAPAVLQVESHPFLGQAGLLGFLRDNGIAMTAYSPLASGGRTRPDADGQHTGFSIVPHRQAALHPVLVQIAEAHGSSPATVAIRWQVQRGVVVVPKSVNVRRLRQNFEGVLSITLSEAEMGQLDALNEGLRLGWGGPKADGEAPRDAVHPLYPFKEAEWLQ